MLFVRRRAVVVSMRMTLALVCLLILGILASTASAWTPRERLSLLADDASSPHVGISDAQNSVFVWERNDPIAPRVQMRGLTGSGPYGPLVTLPGVASDEP